MPLSEITANSKEELISKIIKKEMESGKSQEQASAIAYEEAKKRGYKDIELRDSGKIIKKYSGFIVQIKEGLYVSSPTNKTTKNEGMAAVIETEEEAKWLLEWHLNNIKDVKKDISDVIKYWANIKQKPGLIMQRQNNIKTKDGFQGMICDKCGSDRVIEGKANNWECKDCGNTTKFRHGDIKTTCNDCMYFHADKCKNDSAENYGELMSKYNVSCDKFKSAKDMKGRDVHVRIGERITPLAKTPYQNGFTYFGKQSCQSCRNVDYNGQKCNCTVSPKYGKQITTQDWCRYHFATLHVKSLKS